VKSHDVIQRPLVTEKSTLAREQRNAVTFAVSPQANKHQIQRAVEELFGVKVLGVRTKRRVGRHVGRKPEWKKAIVQLAPGQAIEFFEGV
jgi:large subunit ribosomal protein L23